MTEKQTIGNWEIKGYKRLDTSTPLQKGMRFFLPFGEDTITTFYSDSLKGMCTGSHVGRYQEFEIIELHRDKPGVVKIKICPEHPCPTKGWTEISKMTGAWCQSKRIGSPMSPERAEELLDRTKDVWMRAKGVREAMLDAMDVKERQKRDQQSTPEQS